MGVGGGHAKMAGFVGPLINFFFLLVPLWKNCLVAAAAGIWLAKDLAEGPPGGKWP